MSHITRAIGNSAFFVKRDDILTGTWREGNSAPRYSDVALQLVPYDPLITTTGVYVYTYTHRVKSLREQQDLVEGLCNPLVWHRHPVSHSQLKAAFDPLKKAMKLVRSPQYQECWDSRIERAIRHSDLAWARFLTVFALARQHRKCGAERCRYWSVAGRRETQTGGPQ
jgi:hypothetical protein